MFGQNCMYSFIVTCILLPFSIERSGCVFTTLSGKCLNMSHKIIRIIIICLVLENREPWASNKLIIGVFRRISIYCEWFNESSKRFL